MLFAEGARIRGGGRAVGRTAIGPQRQALATRRAGVAIGRARDDSAATFAMHCQAPQAPRHRQGENGGEQRGMPEPLLDENTPCVAAVTPLHAIQHRPRRADFTAGGGRVVVGPRGATLGRRFELLPVGDPRRSSRNLILEGCVGPVSRDGGRMAEGQGALLVDLPLGAGVPHASATRLG